MCWRTHLRTRYIGCFARWVRTQRFSTTTFHVVLIDRILVIALRMMDFVLKMMDFVLKKMDFVLNMMDFVLNVIYSLQGCGILL